MTSSFTVAFSGTSSVLRSDFLPEILLDEQYDYSCALLDLIIKNENENKIDIHGVILIDCDIISGSYINGARKQTIHQFAVSTSLETGHTFVEVPKHLNYFPIKTKNLQSIQISIADQKGELINGYIFIRLNIKRTDKQKSC